MANKQGYTLFATNLTLKNTPSMHRVRNLFPILLLSFFGLFPLRQIQALEPPRFEKDILPILYHH